MTSWWDSAGAASLLTGGIALISFALGLFLRPWTERRLRRIQQEETSLADARQLVIDLQTLLMRGLKERATPEDRRAALSAWNEALSPRTIAMFTFGSSDRIRKTGKKLWLEVDRLSREVERIERTGQVPEFGTDSGTDFDETLGEAAFALEHFIEAVGGPGAPTREEFPMVLRDRKEPEPRGNPHTWPT